MINRLEKILEETMKSIKKSVLSLLAFAIVFTSISTFADPVDITVSDGYYNNYRSWYSNREDNEVEIGCVRNQNWDLEGFILDDNELSIVGGFNFKDGYLYPGDGHTYKGGDIFIDIDDNTSGFNFVIDMDYENGTYKVYTITDKTGYVKTSDVNYSNPYRVDLGGDEELLFSGTLDFTGPTGEELDLLGVDKTDVHYKVSGIDLSFLDNYEFKLHYTLECGNDLLKGQGSVALPEPGTFSLLLIGSMCMVGFWSIRRRKD